jgi:hypothetical protein
VSQDETVITTAASQPTMSREWCRWTSLALLNGTPLVDVLAMLSAEGFSEAESVGFCASLYDNPAFDAGQWLSQQLGKLHSVLQMREQMRSLSAVPVDRIDRRTGLSGQEFLDEYYAQNIPVILTDVCQSWPALTLWNGDYLAKKLGAVEVEVMAGRESDSDYEINSNEHKYLMPFDEYVAKIEAIDSGNDLYLVANNKLLERVEARSLWDDIAIDQRFLRPDPTYSQAFLWFGPAGTITPLHHDSINVLFNQIDGWKHFRLVPSLEIYRVYNNVAVYSKIDPLAPDFEQFPLFRDAHTIHLDVGPGESLFIPAGWWHHVESLEASISISFTNFAYSNQIEWVHPTISL